MNARQVKHQHRIVTDHVRQLVRAASDLAAEFEIDRSLEHELEVVANKAAAVAEEAKL